MVVAKETIELAFLVAIQLLPGHRLDRPISAPTEDEQAVLRRLIDAHERDDAVALVGVMREDIRVTMPPNPDLYVGRASMAPLLERAFGPERFGDWRLVPTRANRRPAAASYCRRPGDGVFRAFKLDVMRVEDGVIAEITTFDASLFEAFGLAATL